MPTDYRGMSPEQATRIAALGQQNRQQMADFAKALAGQQLQERKFAEQKRQARVNEKLQKVRMALDQAVQQKKLKLQEQRNQAYQQQVESQADLTEAKLNKLKSEQRRLDNQLKVLEGMQGSEVDTNLGKMSAYEFAILKQLEVPVETQDSEWKKFGVIETTDGQKAVWFKPDTMETKTLSFGAEPSEGGISPEQKRQRKEFDEAEQTIKTNLNASSFYGMKKEDQDVFNEVNTLAQEMLVSGQYDYGKRAGSKAYRVVRDYRSQVDKLTGDPNKDQQVIKRMVQIGYQWAPIASDQMDLFTPQWIVRALEEKGYDSEDASKIVKSTIKQLRGE